MIPRQRTRPRRKRLDDPAFLVRASQPPKLERKRKATRVIVSNTEHRDWLSSLGCCICGRDATWHHLLETPNHEHGMGHKSSDDWTIPMCHHHHDQLHRFYDLAKDKERGRETRWLGFHFIHGPSLAALLRQLSGQPIEVGERAIDQHRVAMGLRRAA